MISKAVNSPPSPPVASASYSAAPSSTSTLLAPTSSSPTENSPASASASSSSTAASPSTAVEVLAKGRRTAVYAVSGASTAADAVAAVDRTETSPRRHLHATMPLSPEALEKNQKKKHRAECRPSA